MPAPKLCRARRSSKACLPARDSPVASAPGFTPRIAAASAVLRPSMQHSTKAARCPAARPCTSSATTAKAASHAESATGCPASGRAQRSLTPRSPGNCPPGILADAVSQPVQPRPKGNARRQLPGRAGQGEEGCLEGVVRVDIGREEVAALDPDEPAVPGHELGKRVVLPVAYVTPQQVRVGNLREHLPGHVRPSGSTHRDAPLYPIMCTDAGFLPAQNDQAYRPGAIPVGASDHRFAQERGRAARAGAAAVRSSRPSLRLDRLLLDQPEAQPRDIIRPVG